VVAAQMGKIMLTLRRPDEHDEAVGEEVTPLADILSGRAKNASESGTASSSTPAAGSGFMQFVKDAVGATPPAGSPTAPTPAAVEPAWVMHILSPAETKRFEFTDKTQLPTEATISQAAPAAAPASTSPMMNGRPTHGPESLENPDKPGIINAPDAGADSSSATG